jgi:hypothetical protein
MTYELQDEHDCAAMEEDGMDSVKPRWCPNCNGGVKILPTGAVYCDWCGGSGVLP